MSNREVNEPRVAPVQVFTPFLPLCLMALSLALFFGWQVTVSVRQYITLLRLGDQQAALAEQAAQTESRLQSLIIDVLKLSKTDADAKAIVNKYGIKFNPPGVPPGPAAAAPRQPKPQPKDAAGAPAKPPATGGEAVE